MGQSPSADLFWGYDLGDLTDRETYDDLRPGWMEDDCEFEEELARKLGWIEVPFPSAIADIPRSTYAEMPEYRAWTDSRSEMRRLAATVPVALDFYGYMDEPTYCVRVNASLQQATDWGSTALSPLVVLPEWSGQLAEFMRLLELPIPDGASPGWHMNCSYG